MGKSIPTLPPDQALPTALQILGKLSIIKQKLQAFYSELESTYPKQLCWERVSPTRNDAVNGDRDDSEFVFPPSLWFNDLDVASMLTLYWAILAMVSFGQQSLSKGESLTNQSPYRCRFGLA